MFARNGVIIIVYVDDMLIFGTNLDVVQETKDHLSAAFSMTDLGPCSYFLGMHVVRNSTGAIHLHQTTYIEQILVKYDLQGIYPRKTPLRTDRKLQANTGNPLPLKF